MEPLFLVISFLSGIFGGFYAANVGGGALVGFPIMVLIGLPTANAIATQRFAAVILEFVSAIKFYKEGKLNLRFGLILGIIAAVGAVIGTNIVLHVDERYLNIIIGILLLVVFIVLFNKDRVGIKEKNISNKNLIQIALFTFLLSIYGGFFGAGFGTLIMFLLVFAGFTFIKGAAISRVVGFFMSVASAIVFAHSGLINYAYGLSLGLGFALGGWVGIGVALKKGDNYVRTLLGVIILISVLKLVSGFFNIKLL
ncbi:MAG: hypothetical protein A2Y57_04470 [Candidatus Woykebacteria bacterium RBG_13_40_7b]|uniref:Probable membrane transporter protein n=1 Tax=Candidatus Woykebacteria bacterium RBG_13_40_7b TaxID=1802594 RepID=A0A1G1W7T9_9BACT|nr:MAG: hypothetical protein A2Y57_04470 [Candidatus Woykebacteria bacterium RBG_13_40_7b]